MQIAVVGLWHLGTVTAACLAKAGFEVIAYDGDATRIQQLQQGKLPVAEPGLDALLFSSSITYTTQPTDLQTADVVWITYDTPVDEEDRADVAFVLTEINRLLPHLKPKTTLLISSQVPVGTSHQLQAQCDTTYPDKQLAVAYSPENLRLGKAIDIFMNPDRIVIGIQHLETKQTLLPLLQAFSTNLIWMSLTSAEMTKHALNAFLATSVVFTNELARLCERVGADAREVEQGLKSEMRIGPHAYLKAGNAFAGGTLARDVRFLQQISAQTKQSTPLFDAILPSNEQHKQWAVSHLTSIFSQLSDKKIALLGLTYKPGTNTLRRSGAIELATHLHQQGATLSAYDPAITDLPDPLQFIQLAPTAAQAIADADAVIIATEWPDFTELDADVFAQHTASPLVFDINGYLATQLATDERIRYFRIGKSA